jgi:DNA-binding transcriptional MerR regulator
MAAEEFLIGELANKTGVSVRTIRFYISEGLLPSPQSRGRYTVYDEEYIGRIELIKRLKEAFLPIKEIRLMLEMQNKAEIEAFLRNYENTRSTENDALDYIAGVMESKKMVSDQPANIQFQSPPANLRPRQSPMPAAKRPADFGDEENWKRFKIIPGFEFHITERIFNRNERVVWQLIEKAKALLSQ